jgi:hypothetical protein
MFPDPAEGASGVGETLMRPGRLEFPAQNIEIGFAGSPTLYCTLENSI